MLAPEDIEQIRGLIRAEISDWHDQRLERETEANDRAFRAMSNQANQERRDLEGRIYDLEHRRHPGDVPT